jgi:excisionase family DNA binding protein
MFLLQEHLFPMRPDPDPLDLLTIKEVSAKLKLSPLAVRRILAKGELRAFKVGKEWRLRRQDLLDWMESNSNQKNPKK